jgi:hypothetical protein
VQAEPGGRSSPGGWVALGLLFRRWRQSGEEGRQPPANLRLGAALTTARPLDTQTTARHIPGNVMPAYDVKSLIPPKYALDSTSGLTAKVEDDDNYFEFNLIGNLTGK